jgi:hypothetical protein
MGFAGRPLSGQYKGENSLSNISQSILLVNMKAGAYDSMCFPVKRTMSVVTGLVVLTA